MLGIESFSYLPYSLINRMLIKNTAIILYRQYKQFCYGLKENERGNENGNMYSIQSFELIKCIKLYLTKVSEGL